MKSLPRPFSRFWGDFFGSKWLFSLPISGLVLPFPVFLYPHPVISSRSVANKGNKKEKQRPDLDRGPVRTVLSSFIKPLKGHIAQWKGEKTCEAFFAMLAISPVVS